MGRNKEEAFATEKDDTYRELLKNMSPADCAVVEDAKAGIEAAKADGMTALALFRDAKGCGLEDYDLTFFSDLLNILP